MKKQNKEVKYAPYVPSNKNAKYGKLAVLLVEDTPLHQLSARLIENAGHHVSIESSFEGAIKAFFDTGQTIDGENDYYVKCNFKKKSYGDRYGVGKYEGEHKRQVIGRFDVLLTDLFFPLRQPNKRIFLHPSDSIYPTLTCCTDRKREFEPDHLGLALALYAAKLGVPYIGIHPRINHHESPIAAVFDLFKPKETKEDEIPRTVSYPTFTIGNSKVMIFNEYTSCYFLKNGTPTLLSEDYWNESSSGGKNKSLQKNRYLTDDKGHLCEGKNWKTVLDELVGNSLENEQ